MKKLLAVFLSAALLTGCSTSKTSTETGSMKAGTYTATAEGYHGDITIDVTVSDTAITKIEVTKEEETEGIGKAALPKLVEQAVADQTADVDIVSGATLTSNGFKTALTDALTQAGADMSKFAAASSDKELEAVEETVDVVIVGAGVAGLSAALAAQQKGKNVLVLEKMSLVGGASAMAGAGTVATGSTWQKEAGYEDSAESLKADMLANGHNKNDEATLDIFVNTVGEAFDWLVSEDGANVPYEQKDGGARVYSGTGRGSGVVTSLSDSFSNGGGTILTDTKATELIVEDGTVTGVLAESKDKAYTIHAQNVILATGGFGHNTEMIPEEYQSYVYAGADGDGLTMAAAVDADTINMEYVNVQPNSIIMPSGLGQYTNPGVATAYKTSGAFIVNQDGVRFMNEQGNAWDMIQAMKVNESNYLILDQAAFDAFNGAMIKSHIYTQEDVDKWVANNGSSNPVMIKADSLEELGSTLSLPESSLSAAAEKYNEDVAKGTDEFGRTLTNTISSDGSYYAIQMWLRYYATLGGLHINDQMQVLNTAQEPIEGLYAAGEVVGGLEGDIYYGGSLFGWAMTSGYDAAKSITAE